MTETRLFDTSEEISKAVGETIGPGDWLRIDQNRIDAFAIATDDHQWIHVDSDRAAGSSYGGTIAHGYLTQSLIPAFALGLYKIRFGISRVNYGSNRVRFPAPVRSGSRVRASATFTDCRSVEAGVLLTVEYVLEVEGNEKPACIAECVTLVVI